MYIELPIAFITNGELIFSPFILIIFPSHVNDVVETTLWSFIDIASAPAFLSSFITPKMSGICTITMLGSNMLLSAVTVLLSFSVTITPSPVTSVNPINILFFFNSASFSSEPSVFSLACCLTSSSFFSDD